MSNNNTAGSKVVRGVFFAVLMAVFGLASCGYGEDSTAINTPVATSHPATTYTISASAGSGGTVTPSGIKTVTQGASQTYTITPGPGYIIATLAVDGSPVPTSTTHTFTDVHANHTINATFSTAPGNGVVGLSAQQKLRAEQITSVFENDTIELQYAYIENINDGRGYTAGRAGFTTATGDLVIVAQRYAAAVPGSEFASLLPRLVQLAQQQSGNTSGLENLPQAWINAANDVRFRQIQDEVVDEMYYQPALDHAVSVGLKFPLSIAALYDAIIQHGDGDDPDGLSAMIARASTAAGGTPLAGIGERQWLAAFLQVRRATLAHATNPETRAAWALDADRPVVFQVMLDAGNLDLNGPIAINTKNHNATIP